MEIEMEILKQIEHIAAHVHHVMPRFRWVHKCEDNNAVHLPASVSSCPHCDTVNENHAILDLAAVRLAA